MKRMEWQTLCLFIAVYLGWMVLTLAIAQGLTGLYVILALVLTQHSSLQHEAIHGHPTPWHWVNSFLATPAVNLLLPYERFRNLHLQHHRNWLLTDPFDDTESYFMAAADWHRLSSLHQKLLTANNTVMGRMLLGPWIMYWRFLNSEIRLLLRRSPGVGSSWLKHLAGLVPVLLWLNWLELSIPVYLLAAVWPSTSMLLLRAYAEHIPVMDVDERSAIVCSIPAMGLLYLNNNFHRVHHDHPALAWYKIPSKYRQQYAAHQGNHIISGYGTIWRNYALRPKYPVAHPVLRTETSTKCS